MSKTLISVYHKCPLGVKFRLLPFSFGQQLYQDSVLISDEIAFEVSVRTGAVVRGLHHFDLEIRNSGLRKVQIQDFFLKRNGFRQSKCSSSHLKKNDACSLSDVIVDYEDHRWNIDIEFSLEIR